MKLTKIYEQVLSESTQTTFIAYHGTDYDINRFSDSFIDGDRVTQHHGAGIYFATNYENARMFGKNVYKVELSGNFINEDNPTSDVDPDKLIELMKLSDDDEWELEAQNYHPDPEVGLMVALEDALDRDNEADAFMRIQSGWYNHNGIGYVRSMVKIGVDGVIVNPPSDWVDEKHIIMFNPNAIKFISKMDVNEELTYRHTNTDGVEDDEYEVGMVKEGTSNSMIAYHGTKQQINAFVDDFVGDEEATDQEGPGIYFTTKTEETIKYAQPNGYVYKVELNPKNFLSNEMGFDFEYLIPSVTKLIKMAPNWKGIVMGYDEGIDELVYQFISMAQSEKEVFVNLYHEVFKTNAKLFVRGMVKLGYDGLFLPSRDGGSNIVVYNPKIIKVLGVKQL